jgi:phage I-like protein
MPSRAPRTAYIALLAAALTLSAQAEVQLLPAGEFAARDGRPGNGQTWKITDAAGTRLAAELTRMAAQSAFVFDYDHQTIRAEANGQPAPAAGWATQFVWRAGTGLFATDVTWTEAAQARIQAGEYRYVSPVITFAKADGRITGVLMAAVTNYPALLGMEPLGQALSAHLSAQFLTHDPEPTVTLIEQLIATLGLKAGACETDALSAIAALKSDANTPTKAAICASCPLMTDNKGSKAAAMSAQITTALGLKDGADVTAALAAITTLQTQAQGTDATTATTIAALQSQLATLTTAAAEAKVDEVVQAALSAGKLLPAQKAWATDLGKRDLTLLQGYVAGAPSVAALHSQTGGKAPGGTQDDGLNAEALAGKARAYQAEQLAAGVQISTAQAVMHVNKGPAPAAE